MAYDDETPLNSFHPETRSFWGRRGVGCGERLKNLEFQFVITLPILTHQGGGAALALVAVGSFIDGTL